MPRITRPAMADYGVPKELDGALPWSWAEERLAASRNFWLVTVSAEGRPHALPVWGVWMPDRERYGFSCSPRARKVRNLEANDQVVITNDDAVNVVSIEGRAERIDGDPARVEAMARAYQAKYAAEEGFDDVDGVIAFLGQNAAYEIAPSRAFGVIETPEDFGPRATRWIWD
ncbi:MAG: pyridoxamine 5'-phosphate oxidase family protein [Actinomycetota bacterium]